MPRTTNDGVLSVQQISRVLTCSLERDSDEKSAQERRLAGAVQKASWLP